MSRKWLRFPLRSEEQLRVLGSTITVLDGGPSWPDRLRLEFEIFDPAGGSPPLMPLFPGMLSFRADPQAAGVIPKATDAFSWSTAQYATWKTVGTLVVELHPALAPEIAALPGTPSPSPAIAWYWPVRLTQGFLFDAIRTHLVKDAVRLRTGGRVATSATNWPQHAVAGFLAGTHKVQLRRPVDPLQDDAVKFLTSMPTVEMAAGGEVGLWLALAAGTGVDDGQNPPSVPGTTPLLDPAHPGNALLPARKTLTDLAPDIIGAEQPGSALAAAALASFGLPGPLPTGPRHFQIVFTTPGLPLKPYLSGSLPAEQVTVRDAADNVVQQHRIPTDGVVTVAQGPASPLPAPPRLKIEITSNALRIGDTNGSRAALAPNAIGFDFATLDSPARVSLQPPALAPPVTAAARKAYSQRLARLSLTAARAPTTKQAVAESLAEYEATIRPTTWGPSDLVFRGTRAPWAGSARAAVAMPLGAPELQVLFDALQNIAVTGPTPPVVRPGEALVLWLMEGRIFLVDAGLLAPGAATAWTPLGIFPSGGTLQPFSAAQLAGADPGDVVKLVRTLLLWLFFGLDELTKTAWSSSALDTVLTWDATLAASLPAHDAALAAGLAAIGAAGVTHPTAAAITGTIEAREVSGLWEFRLLPGFLGAVLWAQYAEYLRRLVAYTVAAQTNPHPAMPVTARRFPAFSYIAFNARTDVVRAAEFWARAAGVLAGAPPAWVKTPEDALRSWRLEPAEETATPRGGMARSKAVRVNGLHFAALARSFGAVLPRVVFPST
jgi:hypothetical protein